MSHINTNIVIISGRLTADAKLENTTAGTPLLKFSIATNFYAGKGKDPGVSFFNCTLWNNADTIAAYMIKGQAVVINGELRQQRWQGKDGNPQSRIDINVSHVEFTGSKQSSAQQPPAAKPQPSNNNAPVFLLPL